MEIHSEMNRIRLGPKEEVKKGKWSSEEDRILIDYIRTHGEGKWANLPTSAGLTRSGKSCRLRWLNYLRPGIVRGNITKDEEDIIIKLQGLIGNRWSLIAEMLPGRTDNEIKNYWNTNLSHHYSKPTSTITLKRSKTLKRKKYQRNKGLQQLEKDPHCNQASTFDYPIIEGKMAINDDTPIWINGNNPNVAITSSTMNMSDHNGPSDNIDANSATGSTLEQEAVNDELFHFIMEFDSAGSFNNIFDQDEVYDVLNPSANYDQFPRMAEEDHPAFTIDVSDHDPQENLPSLPLVDPLPMDTYGNGNRIDYDNNKERDPNMNDLIMLACFHGMDYI